MIPREEITAEIRRIARGISHWNLNRDTVWVSNSETLLDALGHLYEKLDGGDLKYAIDIEDDLLKEKKAREDGLLAEQPRKNAVERAQEMMGIKQCDLPPLAYKYAMVLCNRVGMCMETYLTAFAYYAQAIEKRSCTDDLYTIPPDAQRWFDEKCKVSAEPVPMNRPRNADDMGMPP